MITCLFFTSMYVRKPLYFQTSAVKKEPESRQECSFSNVRSLHGGNGSSRMTRLDKIRRLLRQSVNAVSPVLKRNMLVTNTASSAILFTMGDVIQQRIEKSMGQRHKHDVNRSGRMFLVGLSQGPPHHYWYVYLDKWLPKKTAKTVLLKILADQFFAAPFFAVTFIVGMGILQDKRLSECWSEFKKKFPYIYLFDWCIWPPSQYINFRYIPQSFRVFYVNVVTIIWDVFLSYVKHFDELETIEKGEGEGR